MNFLNALKHAEQGKRIRRAAWSHDPSSDDFHVDLVIRAGRDKRLLANNHNMYYSPNLTTVDYRARDWEVAGEQQ